ncbi:hypothetical protein DV737_g1957, partial [Chaetothyriales sp. CBS 132003]
MHSTPLLLRRGSDRVSINFDSPCDGCFIGSDAALKLTLDVDRAEDECTGSGIRLNGVDLAQSVLPTTPSTDRGLVDFGAIASNGVGDHEYTAEWYLTCLDGQVNLLNVQFKQKSDPARGILGGFSTSFQQTHHPWIMKLDPTLSTLCQEDVDTVAWASPSPEESLRIGLPPGDALSPHGPVAVPLSLPADLPLPDGLREQMEKLWKLKFEKQKLNTEIEEVASDVVAIWKAEFSECSTLTCYVRTALKNVPIIFRLIIHSLKHESSVPQVINSTEGQVRFDVVFGCAFVDATTSDDIVITVLVGAPSLKYRCPPPWAKPGDHRTWGHGQPPWESSYPQGPETEPVGPGSPGSASLESWVKGVPEDQERLRMHVMAALVSFVVVAVVALGLLFCVKHRNYIWRNPRMRVECMARREEWKRRKAYRKAACKHQFRTFFARLAWLKQASGSEAEKEEFLRNKARNEGSAFDQEIDGLRLASEIVGELVRADDPRAHSTGESDTSERTSISEPLPRYSEPPGYTSAADGEISVIDGFTGYTPSGTDESAESTTKGAATDESIASPASQPQISKSQKTVEELEKELFWLANNNPTSKHIDDIFNELTTARGVTPTSAHYEALVLRNCDPSHGSVDRIKDVLAAMRIKGVAITASVYQAALMVLAVHPSTSFQRHVISAMTAQWMSIPAESEHAIIASLIRDDQLELAHTRLIGLAKPPEWLYVLLVHALCVAKDFSAILQLAYDLHDRRLDLPRPSWNHLLDEAVRNGDFNLTLYLWLHHVEPMYIAPSYDTCTGALGLAAANTSPKLAESAMLVLESLYHQENVDWCRIYELNLLQVTHTSNIVLRLNNGAVVKFGPTSPTLR